MTKIFQKSLASVLALALCLTALITASATVSAEEGTSTTTPALEYVVTPASPKKGETVKVELVAKNFNDVAIFGADIVTYYDSKLELTADNITFGFKDGYETVTVDKHVDTVNKKIGIVGLGGYENGVYTPFLDNFNSTTLYSFEFVAGDAGTEYTFSFASDTKVRFCTSGEQEVTVAAAAKTVTVAAEAHTHEWTYSYEMVDGKCVTTANCACGATNVVASLDPIEIKHALSLDSALTVIFRLAAGSESNVAQYTDVHAIVNKDMYNVDELLAEKDITNVPATIQNGGTRTQFVYDGIRSIDICSNLDVKVFGTNSDGIKVLIAGENYKFVDYLNSQYAKNATAADGTRNAAFRQLLADIAYYGAAAQNYFTYNRNNLANSQIPDTYVTGIIAAEDFNTTTSNSNIKVAFDLKSKIEVKSRFMKTAAPDGSYFKFDYKIVDNSTGKIVITNKQYIVQKENFGQDANNENRYEVIFDQNPASSIPLNFTMSLCDSEGNVLDSREYGVETYAYSRTNNASASAAEKLMDNKMVAYGRSAYAYFAFGMNG